MIENQSRQEEAFSDSFTFEGFEGKQIFFHLWNILRYALFEQRYSYGYVYYILTVKRLNLGYKLEDNINITINLEV